MRMKKSLAAILSSTMALSMLSVSAAAANAKPVMEDAANSWAASSIDRWVQHGIVEGNSDGTFKPYRSLSRGELAAIFTRMFGLTEKAENKYADLTGSEWYADAILKCTAAGILEGDGKNANAAAPVTRQEAMTMFARAMGMAPDASPDLSQFTDGGRVADWAAGYMAPLAEMGILDGVGGGRVAPDEHIDRASTMALLDKAIEEYITSSGEIALENENGFTVINAAASARDTEGVTLSGKAAGLVISAGTAADVTADGLTAGSVRIDGRTSVSLDGAASAGRVNVHAAASVSVGASSQAGEITLHGADASLSVFGSADRVEIAETAASASVMVATDASVETVAISAAQTELSAYGSIASVDVTKQAADTLVSAESGAQIDRVSTAGTGTTVKGAGKVSHVAVSDGASGVTVNTIGSKIDNNSSEAVSSGTGSIQPGHAGTSNGENSAPTQDGPSSGGSGSGGGDTVQQADIVKAPLLDQSGTIDADALVRDYQVSSTVKGDVTEVTISGEHLMKHQNAQGVSDYWIGFGIPAKEGNTYYAGYGAVPEELGAPVDSIADRTYEENGKTYNTVYFGLKDVDLENGAYVVVKNGEDTAAYRVSFQVTLAPVVENMQVWVVNDQASYERLPADYTGAHPWDDAYLQPENAAALPWLAVSYDSNVTGAVEIQVTKDGTPVGSKSHAESTVNTDRYQLWHLTKPADSEGRDYFDQEDAAGSYVVTIRKDGQTVSSEALVYAP